MIISDSNGEQMLKSVNRN